MIKKYTVIIGVSLVLSWTPAWGQGTAWYAETAQPKYAPFPQEIGTSQAAPVEDGAWILFTLSIIYLLRYPIRRISRT